MLKATLDISDAHFGDAGQLLATLEECADRAIAQVKDAGPDEVEVVLNGDWVAGRGIFRDQGLQSTVQLGSEQVWFGAWYIRQWQVKLKAARWVVIRGNHDQANKEDLARELVMILRALDVPAVYQGRTYVGNFSPDESKPCWFEAQHGFGASSYYANSYEGIRDCWRMYIQHSQQSQILINRFLRGHTHWLNVGQAIGFEVAIDTTGGWHRQERDKLSSAARNTGLLLYLHDGLKLQPVPIEADCKLLTQETDDPGLHYQTMARAAAALSEATRWARAQGLA